MIPSSRPPSAYENLIHLLGGQNKIKFDQSPNAIELSDFALASEISVILLCVGEKEDLTASIHFLELTTEKIQSGTLRVIVLNKFNHPKIISVFKSKGVSEVLDSNIPLKPLNLKIKQALTAAQKSLNKNQAGSAEVSAVGGIGNVKSSSKASSTTITWVPAHEHPSDFFIVTNKRNARYMMGQWLVDILGPGPSAGIWEESQAQMNGHRGWHWKSRDPNDKIFDTPNGAWIFFGNQPEFRWQKNLWSFKGRQCSLVYYEKGEPIYYRIHNDETGLKIAENSNIANARMDDIRASLEASVRLSENISLDEVSPHEKKAIYSAEEQKNESESDDVGSDFADVLNKTPHALSVGTSGANGAIVFKKDEPSVAWNNQTGDSQGVNFNKGPVSFKKDTNETKWNQGDLSESGPLPFGIGDLLDETLETGTQAFEQIELRLSYKGREVDFIELLENEALFDIEESDVRLDEKVSVQLELINGGAETRIDVEGNADSIHPSLNGRALVRVGINPAVRKRFTDVLDLFEKRQAKLSAFFRRAKGE